MATVPSIESYDYCTEYKSKQQQKKIIPNSSRTVNLFKTEISLGRETVRRNPAERLQSKIITDDLKTK
jgi:hypothetical protein